MVCSVLTLQSFEIGIAFYVGTDAVAGSVFEVAPGCDVLETLVVFPVFEILGSEEANTSAGVNKVIKFDNP